MSIEEAMHWSRVLLVITAICTSSFPILYLFSPWYKSALGRASMLQSASLALALNLSVFLTFRPVKNLWFLLWLNFGILSLIAIASATLTLSLWRLNYRNKKEKEDA